MLSLIGKIIFILIHIIMLYEARVIFSLVLITDKAGKGSMTLKRVGL